MKKRRSFWLVSYPGQERNPRINFIDMAKKKAIEELKQDGGVPPFKIVVEHRGNGVHGWVQEV
jgi:hypothetical protein